MDKQPSSEKPSKRIKQLKSWLELIRVPNLLTVPGDTLAGFSLATIVYPVTKPHLFNGNLICLILASTLIYAAGIIQNDIADLKIDQLERPQRPLPSKRVSLTSAKILAAIFYLSALLLISYISYKAIYIALLLICLVICYNFYTKQYTIAGAATMGLCRGFNILLGASTIRLKALLDPLLLFAFLITVLYIFFICLISQKETQNYNQGSIRWLPSVAVFTGFSAFMSYYILCYAPLKQLAMSHLIPLILSILTALIACLWTLKCGNSLKSQTPAENVQKIIGNFIVGLLFIQASFIFIYGGYNIFWGFLIISFWFLMPFVRKHFYCS